MVSLRLTLCDEDKGLLLTEWCVNSGFEKKKGWDEEFFQTTLKSQYWVSGKHGVDLQ